MKNSEIKKELEKVLVAIDKLDCKCKDVRLSIIYNFILEIVNKGKINMDYYNEELAKEREYENEIE